MVTHEPRAPLQQNTKYCEYVKCPVLNNETVSFVSVKAYRGCCCFTAIVSREHHSEKDACNFALRMFVEMFPLEKALNLRCGDFCLMRVIKIVYVLLFLKQLKKSECDDTIYQNATTKEGSERTMPKIKDIFDIDNAIAEHGNKIFLLGGVGSGKSTWVSDILTKKGSVLFVTSRKAKVREDVHYTCFSDIFHWNTNGNQTLITNAKLAFLNIICETI